MVDSTRPKLQDHANFAWSMVMLTAGERTVVSSLAAPIGCRFLPTSAQETRGRHLFFGPSDMLGLLTWSSRDVLRGGSQGSMTSSNLDFWDGMAKLPSIAVTFQL